MAYIVDLKMWLIRIHSLSPRFSLCKILHSRRGFVNRTSTAPGCTLSPPLRRKKQGQGGGATARGRPPNATPGAGRPQPPPGHRGGHHRGRPSFSPGGTRRAKSPHAGNAPEHAQPNGGGRAHFVGGGRSPPPPNEICRRNGGNSLKHQMLYGRFCNDTK